MAKQTEADRLNKLVKAAFDETTHARRDYLCNRAFLSGRQWVYWDSRAFEVRDMPPTEQYRVTADRLLANSRSITAAMLRRPLRFEVLPDAADAASARASRLAQSVVRTRAEMKDWEYTLRAPLTWAAWIAGTGYLVLDWDPEADRPLGMTEDGRRYATGDVVESVCTVLDLAVEPGAPDATRAKWFARCEALPPAEVQERYGLSKEPKADARSSSIALTHDYTASGSRPDLVNVWTVYERPCGDKDGKVSVLVAGEVVDSADWPYPFTDRLPLAVVRETIVPGRYYGDTVLTNAVPLQSALNAATSAAVDHARKASNARYYIPQSAADMLDELTDEAGQVVTWPDGIEPFGGKWSDPPSMPNGLTDTIRMLQQQLDDLMSYQDVNRGDAPGRVDSGLGLALLSENAATPMSLITAQIAKAFGDLGSMILACYATKVKDTRRQRAYSPGQPAEEVAWTGRDLLNHTHVTVPAEALEPKSRTASNRLAMDLFQAGIIADPMQALKLVEMPDIDDAIQALDPHVAKARREVHRIRAGYQQVPDEYDGPTHVMEHMLDKLSESYEQSSPESQQLCHEHLEAHRAVYDQLGQPWPTFPGMPEPPAPAPARPAAPALDPMAAPMQAPMLPAPPMPIVADPGIPMDSRMSDADLAAELLRAQGLL